MIETDNFPLSSCDSHVTVLSKKIGIEVCHVQKGSGLAGSHLSTPAWGLLSSGFPSLPAGSPSLQIDFCGRLVAEAHIGQVPQGHGLGTRGMSLGLKAKGKMVFGRGAEGK